VYAARLSEPVLPGDHEAMPPRGPLRPYESVAADLRRRIAEGEWAVDEALPTVEQLSAHYGVSRATVGRTLRLLASEGLVRIVPRWGTFRAG
jgi:DNA-binding GntR family transcriptional regulator